MSRHKLHLVRLEDSQRNRLREVATGRKSPQGEALRARILLACDAHPDSPDPQIATDVGCAWQTVKKWRERWCRNQTIQEAPRSGRPRTFSP